MLRKKWTDYHAKQWCRHFIASNHRLPDISDFSSNEEDKKSPPLDYVIKNYKSISDFIDLCGGKRGANKIFTLKEMKSGFERFYSEKGYFPSAHEIDAYPYLPTSRTIQRSWGGLANIRKMLNYSETDYRTGQRRSEVAVRVNQLGFKTENELEFYLVKIFGEIFVHTQKRIGHTYVDFFIYTPSKKIAIDVFTFKDIFSYTKNINNKLHTYKNFEYEIIFVPVGESLTKAEIQDRLDRKKFKLLPHMKVMLLDDLKIYLESFDKFSQPQPDLL